MILPAWYQFNQTCGTLARLGWLRVIQTRLRPCLRFLELFHRHKHRRLRCSRSTRGNDATQVSLLSLQNSAFQRWSRNCSLPF